MNLSLITRGWSALKAGKEVANPAAWKQGQVTVNAVTAFLAALLLLLKGTKYDPHMDDATIAYIAGGVYGVVNWIFTVVTTDKIGFTGRVNPTEASVASTGAIVAAQVGSVEPNPRAPGDVGGKSLSTDPAANNLSGGA